MREGIIIEKKSGSLGYTMEFKKIIAELPGIIGTVKKLLKTIEQKIGATEYAGEVCLEVIQKRKNSDIYKVTVDGKTVFLKISRKDRYYGPGGYDEFKSSIKASDILTKAKQKDNSLKDVEIINYLLGYTDKKNDYYVSEWIDSLLPMDEYRKQLKEKSKRTNDNTKKTECSKKIIALDKLEAKIKQLLEGFGDVRDVNMFFDDKNGKLFLFDLFFDREQQK